MISAPVYCRAFIGRRAQLDALSQRFASCEKSEGSIVLIAAEAGMGKSRLVAEFCRALEQHPCETIVNACLEYVQSPFAPFAFALSALAQSQPEVLRAVPNAEAALARLLPHAPPAEDKISEQIDKIFLFDTAARIFQAAASRRPVVAVIDDLHWADAGSLELLQYLATRIAGWRVLIVATYRPDELRRAPALRSALSRLDRFPYVWRFTLEPLSDTEIRELLARALEGRRAPPPQILETIKKEAEGNPLDAEELLKSAVESNVLHRGGAVALPGSLTESILERLQPLGETDRSILSYASAIGRQFDPQLLADVLERPVSDILATLRKAVELQLIVEHAGNGSIAYFFRHALTRDAIYNQLLAVEARPLHAKVAQAIESSGRANEHIPELAYHFWQARDMAKAVKYNELAGDAAVAVSSYHDAAISYDRALEANVSLGLAGTQLQCKLAEALRESGEGERARTLYESVLQTYETNGDTDAAVHVCSWLRIMCYDIGDTHGVLKYAQRAVELAREGSDRNLLCKALVGQANALVNWDDLDKVDVILQEARSVVDVVPRGTDVHYQYVLGTLYSLQDRAQESSAAYREALRLALERENWFQATLVFVNYADAALTLGLREESIATLADYLRVIRERKLGAHTVMSTLTHAAVVYLNLGMLADAKSAIEQALTLPVEERGLASSARAAAVTIGLRTGDGALSARAATGDFVDDASNLSAGHFSATVTAAMVDLLVDQGRADDARALLHRAVELPLLHGGADEMTLISMKVARHGAEIDIAPARARLLTLLQRGNRRYERAALELFDALVAKRNGQRERCQAHAALAEALFEELQLPYERALTLELLDRRSEALAIYRTTGDATDAGRLEKALTPLNRRGRARTELTQREREIAALVAQGMSNLAIAEKLIISERTVESHVAAIFDKLGVSSRAEIAAFAARAQISVPATKT
ncbi:MAG TPA: AAA family ATPase [Candidatus Baltobacteraceae bacterium]|nr:AAA family ATPase [Candidatus Baltobacteraceae bacterium]